MQCISLIFIKKIYAQLSIVQMKVPLRLKGLETGTSRAIERFDAHTHTHNSHKAIFDEGKRAFNLNYRK